MILSGCLSGRQRQKIRILFDMLYTPSELAGEIGINSRQITRVYRPLGCPVVRQDKRLFINGRAFAEWYESTYPKQGLQKDEGFCLTCKKAVKISNCEEKQSGFLIYAVFNCPRCGRKISRIFQNLK